MSSRGRGAGRLRKTPASGQSIQPTNPVLPGSRRDADTPRAGNAVEETPSAFAECQEALQILTDLGDRVGAVHSLLVAECESRAQKPTGDSPSARTPNAGALSKEDDRFLCTICMETLLDTEVRMGPCGHLLHWKCWKGTFTSQGRPITARDNQERKLDEEERKLLGLHLQRRDDETLVINCPCCRKKIWSRDLIAPGVVFGDQAVRRHALEVARNDPRDDNDDDSVIEVTDIFERGTQNDSDPGPLPVALPSMPVMTFTQLARSDAAFPKEKDLSISILEAMGGRMRTVGLLISAFRKLEFDLQERYKTAEAALECDYQSRSDKLCQKSTTLNSFRNILDARSQRIQRSQAELDAKVLEVANKSAEAARRLLIARKSKEDLDNRYKRLQERERDLQHFLQDFNMGQVPSSTETPPSNRERNDTDDNDSVVVHPTRVQSHKSRKRSRQ